GADGIELDVTRCATGEIVVIHDDTLDRTTNGSGPVEATPFYALRELDAGSWFGDEFAGERVPTLSEVLDMAAGHMLINIEIKVQKMLKRDGIEEEVVEMIRARRIEETTVISSFSPITLARIRRMAPDIQCGLLYAPDMPLPLGRAWARHLVRPAALHPHFNAVDAAYIRKMRRAGYRVNPWTVNERADLERMIALDVDGIITDHPAMLREMLGR
ncbi:MAG TPA: glycerophosphodiester phosphodiesterase, partial [Chloroflexi bacterium]|nr:glycerophosphodiester phosphodiesterase [Chloroflexota bacterium]